MAIERISAIVFPGGFNLPLWTAMAHRFLRARDIELDLAYTANSVEQLAGLITGKWDIGLTAFDNIVAYAEGQGEQPVEGEPDLFAFMGGDNGFLRLVVLPEMQTYADLRGKTLSVDAMTTGFAFVLRKMLALNGVSESAVTFERAGGALQRFQALQARKHAGTLLVTPFELMGAASGLRVLQSACDLLPHYQGISGTARRAWARANRDLLVRFIQAYLEALDWLYRSDNRANARDLLLKHVPTLGQEIAQATCDILLAARHGFHPQARIDDEGAATVLRLRTEYAQPQKFLAQPEKYIDLSYYTAAIAP